MDVLPHFLKGDLMTVELARAQRRFFWVAAVSAVILVIALTLGVVLAKEGDIHTGVPLHDWFMTLKSGKGPCCADADGNLVADVDWESRDSHYRVRFKGEWIDVPPDAVITQPNLDGRAMIWPFYQNGVVMVRCFMPGSMT